MDKQGSLTFCLKPYIQPFERELAFRELRALAGDFTPSTKGGGRELYNVPLPAASAEHLADRLAYWESVDTVERIWTRQIKREATTYLVRNGINPSELLKLLPFETSTMPIPNRRCLRYGPHDIHDYRGKFFPQLVKALSNVSELPSGSVILDPMCGSGTTLVEANLAGYEALGLDLNPLSVLISQTKCAILRVAPKVIIEEYERIREALLVPRQRSQGSPLPYLNSLPKGDQRYLTSWFAPHVLTDLDFIARLLTTIPQSAIRDLFWLCLSDILRPVSWQKTDDLRVRREVKPGGDIDVVAAYLAQLGKTVGHVVGILLEEEHTQYKEFRVVHADARQVSKVFEAYRGRVGAVITSPPYATALPYLDTDRLSLCYLKLLPRDTHRAAEYQMIGNREITPTLRAKLWGQYLQSRSSLPREVCRLIDEVDDTYEMADVGFRRKNLPALLGKYFFDMTNVLQGVSELVKRDGHVFVVVGDNHTVADGKRISIETAKLIESIGETVGLKAVETIPMDMLTPRDIFKRNSVSSEHIVHFQPKRHE